MSIKIALAGNPNSGKTTLFNELTGSSQYVGNWPGVTVEKKEGHLRGRKDVVIQDLPGIYSLSPYTLEEVVARNYLVDERPDAILNIVDGANIERNLYLTTRLAEIGIPMVVAVNMMDVVEKSGDRIDFEQLGRQLGCRVIGISALRGHGCMEAALLAVNSAGGARNAAEPLHVFTGSVEHALAHIEESIQGKVPDSNLRWYSIGVFERDKSITGKLNLGADLLSHIDGHIADCERELDDDAESIITTQRYDFIHALVRKVLARGGGEGRLTVSDRIDKVVTNRVLALPIFAAAMFFVYWVAMGPLGTGVTDWMNDVFGAEWLQGGTGAMLDKMGVAPWLSGLITDGVVGGVGAVLGFVPQMIILFLMLCLLEDVGYMARIAFIMDRLFRRFGLSGKSFIPMLVSAGCGVPGVMASRTIESDRDRRMTVMTATFVPCGAKLPIIALIAGAIFGGASWVATSAYFLGVAAIVCSGVILKKTRMFAGEPAPFVMELPAYHIPFWKNVLRGTWERAGSFIKRAGTIIVLASIFIWFTSNYGWSRGGEGEGPGGAFGHVENMDESMLGRAGSLVAPVFSPLGFGNWQSTVATVMGLVAKEEVVGVFGVLYGVDDEENEVAASDVVEDDGLSAEEKAEILSPIRRAFEESSGGFGGLAAYCFLIFNLLCAPCFAAIGAIRREMNSPKWTLFAISYQCALGYVVGLMVFQFGKLAMAGKFGVGTVFAALFAAAFAYLLFRRNRHSGEVRGAMADAAEK